MQTLPIYIESEEIFVCVYFYILPDKNVNKLNSTPFIQQETLCGVYLEIQM